MKTIKVFLVAMALALSVGHARAEDWYMAHVGQEICVPVDDLSVETPGQRLYYHGGDLHTPEDVKRFFAAMGARIEDQSYSDQANGYVAFDVVTNKRFTIVLMNDEAACRSVMSRMRP
jgi:hypothetical protein